MISDLELQIQTTWIECNKTGYDRVVVLNLHNVAALGSDIDLLYNHADDHIKQQLSEKLKHDIGLELGGDFIFSTQPGLVNSPKLTDNQRIVIRLQNEEHFTMLKLHYNGN